MPQYPNITRDSCFELSKETFAYALNISYCWRVVAFVKGGSGSDCGRKHLSFSIPIMKDLVMKWRHTVAVKYSSHARRRMKHVCQNVNSWGFCCFVCFSGAWVQTIVNNKYKDENGFQSLLLCICRKSVRPDSIASFCLRATETQFEVSLTLSPPRRVFPPVTSCSLHPLWSLSGLWESCPSLGICHLDLMPVTLAFLHPDVPIVPGKSQRAVGGARPVRAVPSVPAVGGGRELGKRGERASVSSS